MFVGLATSSVSVFTRKQRVAESESADPNLPVNSQLRAAKTGADDTFTSSQAPSLKQSAGDLISAESDMTSGLAATLSQKVANDLAAESGFIDGIGSVTATYSHRTTNERLGYVKGKRRDKKDMHDSDAGQETRLFFVGGRQRALGCGRQ